MIIARPALDGGRVLVLEDEVFVSRAIQKFLTAAGATDVLEAANTEDALDMIKDSKLDAAVLDIHLKRGTCFDVAAVLADRGVPFVFHSGNDPYEFAKEFPDAVCCAKLDGPANLVESLLQARKNLAA